MPETTPYSIPISERIGNISALGMIPAGAKALIVLAHGAGAPMTHPFMQQVAEAFFKNKIGTLRYNFSYMEKGSRRPDPSAIATKTIGAAIEFAHRLDPELPVFAGGKSFGGRMTSQYAAKNTVDFLKGILFFGFPLHAIGNPSLERAVHLTEVNVPMLFLQGTKDKLAEIDLIQKVVKDLNQSKIKIYEGADHSFKVPKQNIIPRLVEDATAWMLKII